MNADYSDRNPALAGLYPRHIETVRERYDHTLAVTGAAHAVVYSGSPAGVFLDDTTYPFKANPHFVAWLPLTALPQSVIVYTPGETPVLVYMQPRDYWHVVPGEPDGYWTSHFDIRIVHTLDDLVEQLPEKRENCILLGEVRHDGEAFGIERINPTPALNTLHYARSIKTDYELACMRLATRRGVAGHNAALAAFREGFSEFDIHQAYCKAVEHTDNELPYGNIIALNEHAAVLHYTDLDRKAPKESRSFLIDAGAQVHGYASDITRTYTREAGAFADLVDAMDELQQAIVGRVRAGVDYRELHIETHRRIAKLLTDAELAHGESDSLVEEGVTAAFYPHGLGHLLGVQVHDVGGFMQNEGGDIIDPPSGHPYLRLTRVLEADMVLTVEPGVYIIDLLLEGLRGSPAEKRVNWDTVEALAPFGGIRIEDNVRVLEDGVENFTRDAFAP